MINFAAEIARAGLEIKAIKLNPENPFTWASGFRMPIYNDNRMFLFYPEYRKMIISALKERADNTGFFVIAGTSTAGISPATSLADRYGSPLVYVRDKPKDHGLRNRIEGIDAESGLEGAEALLIEDLISTGGSSASAAQAIRDAGGFCVNCISIFSYGFAEAEKIFRGESPYDREGHKLSAPCKVQSILTYDQLLGIAKERGDINRQQEEILSEWRADPFGWGEKHGFPRIEKT